MPQIHAEDTIDFIEQFGGFMIDPIAAVAEPELISYEYVEAECKRVHETVAHSLSYALENLQKLETAIWHKRPLYRQEIAQIKTPSGHNHGPDWLFRDVVTIEQAAECFRNRPDDYDTKHRLCAASIQGVLDAFAKGAEIYPVFLKQKGEQLIQIDGLHRMIAYLLSDCTASMMALIGQEK